MFDNTTKAKIDRIENDVREMRRLLEARFGTAEQVLEARGKALEAAERFKKRRDEEMSEALKERVGLGIGDGGNALTEDDLKDWGESWAR